ncbi:MAG TPA: hypothetical protein VKF17_16825 [Isosphaeraceae bacterium]|nr:hypothetical protein [Isosphaeraceae bacterium]
MILKNTVTSAAVQGATVSAPADEAAPVGFGVVTDGMGWLATPGPNYSIKANGVFGATGNIDWSAASYHTLTTTGTTNLTLTFYTTAAVAASLTTPSYTLGQQIKIRITGTGSLTLNWPSTITWVGNVTAGTGSASAPVIGAYQIDVTLVCTAVGSSPTFDGTFQTG